MRTDKNVRGVIIRGDKILLIHRKKKGEEYFVTPGGGVEDGETLEEGLKREIWEETGLELVGCQLWFEDRREKKRLLYYRCQTKGEKVTLGGPEAKRNDENNWYRPEWIRIKALKKMNNLKPERLKEIEKETI